MIKKYNQFLNENMDLAKSIIAKKMKSFDELKDLLSKNIGYIGKFTEYLMHENIPLLDLENLYKSLLDLSGKNQTIDISKLRYEQVIDKIQSTNNDLDVNSLINKFPSEQKNIAKEEIKNSRNSYNVALQASKKENKEALISKISRYKDAYSLFSALKLFSKEANNDKDVILNYVKESPDSELILDKDNILIIKVNKIKDIQFLGSDTSWCILSETNWRSYTSGRHQYIVYDFDKDSFNPKFKIGFTLNKNASVHAAHDILDASSIPVLNELFIDHSIGYGDLIPAEVEQVSELKISDIKANTSLEKINLLVKILQREQMPDFIKKMMDVYKVRKEGTYINSTLTDGKSGVLKNIIQKYYNNVHIVTEDDINKINPILSEYCRKNYLLSDKILRKNSARLNTQYLIDAGLDIWSDDVLIKEIPTDILEICCVNTATGLYGGSNISYELAIPREIVLKLSDRLNNIYKDNNKDNNFVNLEASQIAIGHKFFKNLADAVIMLNYLLDRPEETPDKERLLSRLSKNITNKYSKLFKMDVDLDLVGQISSLKRDSIPYVIKKDYDKGLYIQSNDIINTSPEPVLSSLLKHLGDHKIRIKLGKQTLDSLRYRSSNHHERLDDYLKKIINVIKTFPSALRKGMSKTDGKITVEIY